MCICWRDTSSGVGVFFSDYSIQISFKKSREKSKIGVCDKNLFLYPKWWERVHSKCEGFNIAGSRDPGLYLVERWGEKESEYIVYWFIEGQDET